MKDQHPDLASVVRRTVSARMSASLNATKEYVENKYLMLAVTIYVECERGI